MNSQLNIEICGSLWTRSLSRSGLLCWTKIKECLQKVVATGLQQLHGHHELHLLQLSWYWVRHGSSSLSWAYSEVLALYHFSIEDQNEGS